MKVYGIAGRKQSGKGSICKFFEELLPDSRVVEFSFAKALKDLAVDLFGIPKKSAFGNDAEKNYPIATWGKYFTPIILNRYGKAHDTLLTGREFLQILGTDVMRQGNQEAIRSEYVGIISGWLMTKLNGAHLDTSYNFHNIWTDILIEDIKRAEGNYDIITVSDVRFFNEVDAIKSVGGKVIRLHRDTGTTDSIPHQSELELTQMQDNIFDYVIHEENNVNLKDLRNSAIVILKEEGLLA